MQKNKRILLIFLGICLLFFYPIFLGKIPFPADLLVSEFSPWKYFSFGGFSPGAFPEKFQYFDTLRQMYPWTTFVIHSLLSFQFPLWNPHNFSGSPLFANSQSAVLYPLHILYFLLPQTVAWTILVMLQPFLASVGTYWYCQKIGLTKWGSIFASIAFGYCLFMSVFLEYNTIDQVFLFLPFVLLLIETILAKKTWWNVTLIPISLSLSFFAGHIQIWGFLVAFSFVYAYARLFSNKKKKEYFILFPLLFILGAGIAAIQLIPTFELIQNASRTFQEYTFLIKNLLLQPSQILLFLSPDIFGNPATKNYLFSDSYPGNAVYIGFIPFVFSIYSLSFYKVKKFILFFALISVVLIIFFFNTPFTQIFYRLNIPLFSTGSPTNALFLLTFSLSILAGYGFDIWFEKQEKKILFFVILLLGIFLSGIGFLQLAHIAYIKNGLFYTVGIGTLTICVLLFGKIFKKKQVIAVTLIGLTVLDLLYFFEKFNPFVPPDLIFPNNTVITYLAHNEGINRFWSYGNAFIQPNIASQYMLFDSNGYDPLYPKWYGEFIASAKNGLSPVQFSNTNRSDALLPVGYTSQDFLANRFERKVLNFLGVNTIVSKDDPTTYLLPSQFPLLWSSNGWQIFHNTQALPRAFIAYHTQVYSNINDFNKKFYSDTFNPRATILIDKSVGNFPQGIGRATITKYSPEVVQIHTISSTKGLLFLSDTYFPGWNAAIDGKATNIVKADYAFRGVSIPQGSHTVIYSYQPFSFSLGFTLTIISLGTLFVVGKSMKRYEK